MHINIYNMNYSTATDLKKHLNISNGSLPTIALILKRYWCMTPTVTTPTMLCYHVMSVSIFFCHETDLFHVDLEGPKGLTLWTGAWLDLLVL